VIFPSGVVALAFFNDLINTIEPLPLHARHLGATSAVLKYAPRRLRPDTADKAKVEADIAYWRQRAFKAETRLRALETRIKNIAARAQAR
jgi:hypothetical protein